MEQASVQEDAHRKNIITGWLIAAFCYHKTNYRTGTCENLESVIMIVKQGDTDKRKEKECDRQQSLLGILVF